MEQLRVLIAEDNDAMRSYIVVLLSKNYQIVGAVANGEELVRSALRLEPDVIVSDISMPVLGGIEARNELISQGKAFPFVFVSIHGKEVFSRLPQDGSVALVYKLEMSEHLAHAVDAVHNEGVWLSPFYRQK
jgi:DNA-binding NarL/FixJ family response regulator